MKKGSEIGKDINKDKHLTNADKDSRPRSKHNYWPLKITVITLVLAAFFSFFTEIISTKSNLIIALLICAFLIVVSIIFDGIAVAVTSCDIKPLTAMAARKIHGSKKAIKLVQNAEKVANICADVIGDICGIISGACSAAIVIKIIELTSNDYKLIFSIVCSSIIAALTVGGKALVKNAAINNSKDMVMLTARVLSIFSPEEKKEQNNGTAKKIKSSK